VLERLSVPPDATVLDAGCGTGRVTALLLTRVPRGRVVAVDASRTMLAAARSRLAGARARVVFIRHDLAEPLPAVGPVDAVVSTATFHWIADHDRLFANLRAVLRPHGQLVAQWGGSGNIRGVLAALADAGETWPGPWNFPTADATCAALRRAGFADPVAWLEDDPVVLADPAALRAYLAAVVLGAHLDRLPARRRPGYLDAVVARLPSRVVDYVRLNAVARTD